MKLYLFRHGIAVDVGERGVRRDNDRMLTQEGRDKTADIGKALVKLACNPGRIIASPLVRAKETADILAKKLKAPVEVADVLTSGMQPSDGTRWLAKQADDELMLVGHEPDLSRLAAYLVSGKDDANIVFKKAGCCCISFDEKIRPGYGFLEWLMQPKQLRSIK